MYFRRRLGRKGVIVAAVLAAGLLVVGPSRLFHNAENDADDASARHRIDMWNEGFQMVKESPLLGIGKGQFADYTQSLIAHNTLIQNMGETGLLGLFVFIALIYASYKGMLQVKESDALGPGDRGPATRRHGGVDGCTSRLRRSLRPTSTSSMCFSG